MLKPKAMDSNKILSADLLDILFEGKNKDYGAYQLRKTYNNRLGIALASMTLICLLFFLTRILANDHGKERTLLPINEIILIKDLDEPKKEPEPIRVKPPEAVAASVKTVIHTPPRIVDEHDVQEAPPEVAELEESPVGLIKREGVKADDFVAPPIEVSTGIVEGPKVVVKEYEKVFTRIEKEARFPGGMEAWKRYLERNLNAQVAAEDGAVMGYYLVKVQFIVDQQGTISNVQAIEVPTACPSCGPEAIKVIKNGPKWEPAIQNGRKVTYQAIQVITFEVAEE
jgi:protein TonB